MLELNQNQFDAVQSWQRARLVKHLSAQLLTLWPKLAEKLGARTEAFVEAALSQAGKYGLFHASQGARYVNLWCVWGPAFEDKPEFRWAADILHNPRIQPEAKIEQLSLRTFETLEERSTLGVSADEFEVANLQFFKVVGQAGVAPWIPLGPSSDGALIPGSSPYRLPCDLTAFDLALGDQSWRSEYRMAWSGTEVLVNHAPYTAPMQRYRTDTPPLPTDTVVPRQVAALAAPASQGPKAVLFLRASAEEVCDEETHPLVQIKSDTGAQVLTGHRARQVKLPLSCPGPTPIAVGRAAEAGAGKPGAPVAASVSRAQLLREVPARHVLISAETCGFRRYGAALGTQEAVVSVYPAEQWLAEFKTVPQPSWHWPQSQPQDAAPITGVRLECDAQPQPVHEWQAAWGQLAPALIHGLDGWHMALTRAEVLQQPRIDITPNLMHGLAALTWGMREQCSPEGSSAFMRAQALVRLMACSAVLDVAGELHHLGAHARIRLHAQGEAPLHVDVLRESPEKELPALLGGVKVAWRFPFQVEIETQSSPDLATMSETTGSMPGALVGEAGLKPRVDGMGWAWYCTLKLEPAVVAILIADPLRGQTVIQRDLWPATPLLDWSAG
jgi:hypothetical protein